MLTEKKISGGVILPQISGENSRDGALFNITNYLFSLTPFSTFQEMVSILIIMVMIVFPVFLLEKYQTNNFGIFINYWIQKILNKFFY